MIDDFGANVSGFESDAGTCVNPSDLKIFNLASISTVCPQTSIWHLRSGRNSDLVVK